MPISPPPSKVPCVDKEDTKKYKVLLLSFCDGIGVIPYVANKVCPDMVYTVAWEFSLTLIW